MAKYRLEIVVSAVSAVVGALVGAFVSWSIAASVSVPGWLLGLLAAGVIASMGVAVFLWVRLVKLRAVRYDSAKRVYYAGAPDATNPGPFCAKCYETGRKLVSVRMAKDSYWCANCRDHHYY